jgi:tRNA wybutosine-synthesizing protein 1
MDERARERLEKQQYRIIGKQAAVKICRWTKNSLTGKGVCYKQQF